MPRPGFVHHATSSPSVSAIVEFAFEGAHRQKSDHTKMRLSGLIGVKKNEDAPSIEFTIDVWHMELVPSVVELHML